jgi:uncharacterized membrane protein
MQISRIFPSGGILGTLVSAAMAGNLFRQWVPAIHPLYDICFTLFLPGSLALLLLAYQPPVSLTTSDIESDKQRPAAKGNSIAACVRRVAAPFVIASLASLMGCLLSYRLSLLFQFFGNGARATEIARAAAACMSASYVGGTVNYMATARLIKAPADLLGSLVTADLFTMAIYFSFLSWSLDWPWLLNKFRNDHGSTTAMSSAEPGEHRSSSSQSQATNLRYIMLASFPLLLATFGIVQLANRFEDAVGRLVPGTACAAISVVAPVLNSLVMNRKWWKPFSASATVWSDFFFMSFFASIGIAANLSSALSMGPACLLFSAIALSVHVLLTIIGSIAWKRLGACDSLELEDVWIASNAAIGGPATAAAFCGRMRRDLGKLQGRTISATVWGVVGYAIGTVVGLGMYTLVGGMR